jgi:inner membrane protein involved in colicin E2 resistance
VVWLISTVKSIRIHPMHYFFIGASFFSFHLLMAYSVDHIPIEIAFIVSSLVSLFLVVTYIARAVPNRTLVKQIAVAQAVYLVFFSYTFFLEQFTGLIITIMSIATLFVSMQYTARFNWSHVFNKKLAAAHEEALGLLDGPTYLPE